MEGDKMKLNFVGDTEQWKETFAEHDERIRAECLAEARYALREIADENKMECWQITPTQFIIQIDEKLKQLNSPPSDYPLQMDKSKVKGNKEIKLLNSNEYVLLNRDDYDLMSKHKWYLFENKRNKYAQNHNGELMHRLIMNAKEGQVIDHKNGNGLDNRKDNLRFVTLSQNNMNARKMRDKSSKYKGVSWHKDNKKWRAEINCKDVKKFLGYFDNEIEAGEAYDKEALKLYGEYAKLNFSPHSADTRKGKRDEECEKIFIEKLGEKKYA